jgi:hypothetical protein
VMAIEEAAVDEADRPMEDIVIESIIIE